MLPTFARLAVCAVAMACCAPSNAVAQGKSPEQVAQSVPVEVPEVITGGAWTDGKGTGVYRALVVLSGDKQPVSHVFLQWIAVKPDTLIPEIARTVAIKEVNDKKLPSAFIALQAEKEGEAVLIITTIDPKTNKEQTLAFKATNPGSYQPTAPPKAP
ncbi:MAG: hypothetical protein F9K44_14370 [Hyphomicrobiaceae bacterium]|nr:MAG: hypothetical protein F9K44_14370 [Hyphomicrobiaceae bacterium]